MAADGADPYPLTDNESQDWWPDWSPDGSRLVFVSTRDDNQELYLINADGSGLQRLTHNPARDIQPAWQPY